MNVAQIRKAITQTQPTNGQTQTIAVLFQFVFRQIDRCRQNHCPPAARFRKTGEKIVSGDNCLTMPDRSQKFLECFCSKRPSMLLLAKHDCIIEVEEDSPICSLQQSKLHLVEADRLK